MASFDFLVENQTMKAFISRCRKVVQNVYAGDFACNELISNLISNYKHIFKTISSTFDADYNHQKKEPLISIDNLY